MDDLSRAVSLASDAEGSVFFNERTEDEWILRGGLAAQQVAKRAVAVAREADVVPPHGPRSRGRSELGIPRHTEEPPRRVLSNASGSASAARGVDRRVQFRRSRAARRLDAEPTSEEIGVTDGPASLTHAFYDTEVDHHWRLPIGKPLRRADIVSNMRDWREESRPTRWSTGTASEGDTRVLRGNAFQVDRTDRRDMPLAWPEEPGSRPRDRTGGRIGGGARWRGLLARKDLVDVTKEAYQNNSENGDHDISPRSSFDIEEANSLYSWDEPPSTSVRGWRSNHSLSFRPKPNDRPRHIRVIGRQKCINDLTDIVDASCEPCVSYDRQIFDPVSKLWTYVEASQPSSSPWELPSQPSSSPWDLRTVGSPVTCSVSGTEEALSSGGTRGRAPASVGALASLPSMAGASHAIPLVPAAPLPGRQRHLRGSSPSPTQFIRVPSAEEAQRAFMASRDQWLGYTKQSIYGPANLEAVIFASEIDESVEESAARRLSSLT